MEKSSLVTSILIWDRYSILISDILFAYGQKKSYLYRISEMSMITPNTYGYKNFKKLPA